jgi:hypothetical protein
MIADECRIMAKHVQARRAIILHIIVLHTTTTTTVKEEEEKNPGSVFYSSDRTIKSKPPATDTDCEKNNCPCTCCKNDCSLNAQQKNDLSLARGRV